jgi:hypothetical protein
MRGKFLPILSIGATLSLAVVVATAVLWVWSYYARWERIEIAHREVTELLDDDGRPYLADERYRGVLFESGNVAFYRSLGRFALGRRSAWEFNETVVGRNLREPGQWLWAASQPDIFGSPDAYAEVGVRSWVVIVAGSVAPLCWSITMIRRRRHHGEGRCSHCGYDLRATPGRCLECGTSCGGGDA